MAAYIIANYKITNPEAYQAYPAAVWPTLAAYGAELVVADPESEVMEGFSGHMTAILKFPSKEDARTWYNSPEYQAAIHLRTDNSEGFLLFADGFVPSTE